MLCRRCPHLIRHGFLAEDGKNFEFRHICGLLARAKRADETKDGCPPASPKKMAKKPVERPKKPQGPEEQLNCENHPFPKVFDFIECQTYQKHFKTTARKNDVVPTKDFQYSDVLNSGSITDMELL